MGELGGAGIVEAVGRPDPRAGHVVFGHSLRDFDRDQMVTSFFAKLAGLVADSPTVSFTASPPNEAIQKTLIIEGLPTPGVSDTPASKVLSISNGQGDEPAAWMAFTQYQRKIRDANPTLFPKVKALAKWVRDVDMTGICDDAEVFAAISKQSLDVYTDAMEGIKITSGNNPEEVFKRSQALTDNLLSNDATTFTQSYANEIQATRNKRLQDTVVLHERAKDPKALHTIVTKQGLRLTYFDVRGLNVSTGGVGIAAEHEHSDIVFLVDDAYGDHGDVKGSKFLLKIPKDRGDAKPMDLHALLSDRLNVSESLYGKGFALTREDRGYGGHPGVIGSPRGSGSSLEPEQLWHAIGNFFDVPRYSAADFEVAAIGFCHAVGVDTLYPNISVDRMDVRLIPDRRIAITVPDTDGSRRLITIAESDMPLYQAVFAEIPEESARRALLMEKNAVTEPVRIAQKRSEESLRFFAMYIHEGDAVRMLDMVHDMNPTVLRSETIDQWDTLFESMSRDESAIRMIWNKDDLTYRITLPNVPDWIRDNLDQYKAERYRCQSLVHTIDSDVVPSLLNRAIESGDERRIRSVGNSIAAIMKTEAYRISHIQRFYDSLPLRALELASDERIPKLMRDQFVAVLKTNQNIERYFSDERFTEAYARYRSIYAGSSEQQLMDIKRSEMLIDGIPDSTVQRNDNEMTLHRFEVMNTEHPDQLHYANVLVEIGRPIEEKIIGLGMVRMDRIDGKPLIEQITQQDFDARVQVPRFITLGQDSTEAARLCNVITSEVKRLIEILPPSAHIRIIRGGFPNVVGSLLTSSFYEDEVTRAALDRIIWNDYSMPDNAYIDSPLRVKRK